jgi:hypothetical protein
VAHRGQDEVRAAAVQARPAQQAPRLDEQDALGALERRVVAHELVAEDERGAGHDLGTGAGRRATTDAATFGPLRRCACMPCTAALRRAARETARMRSVPLAALVVALMSLALATTAPAAPPPAIPGIAAPTPVAAYGDRVVFSLPDGAGGYRLVQRIGAGPVTPLPVAPRRVPFDVDLGPTGGGHVLAVYSRCATEAAWSGTSGVPPYKLGRGCDVYRLDLATGAETRYTRVNASDASEYWPTYWKGRLGFARAYAGKTATPYVYVKDVASSRPSQRMPVGARGENRSDALHLELYGTRLGFGWTYIQGEGSVYELRVDTVGGGAIRLDRTGPGGLTQITIGWPAFENGRAYWSRSCLGDAGGCPGRTRFQMSAYTGTREPLVAESPQYVLSHERAAGVTYALSDVSSILGCQTDPPTTPQCALQALAPAFAPLN